MSNGNNMIISLIAGLIKMILHKNESINHMNHLVEILMLKLIYLIMQQKQIKDISHVDTLSFALKSNLASLKTEDDNSDIGKLVPVPVDLIKLSDVVKHNFVKKLSVIH